MDHTRNTEAYHYTQIFCGACGRFITDIGGFVSRGFSAAMNRGEARTPGVDLLSRHSDYFTKYARPGVVAEDGPCGLSGAGLLMESPMVPDPTLPRLYLHSWLCFHDHGNPGASPSGKTSTSPRPKLKGN
ncbi:hypothetical protein F5X96DRAFT_237471 [Biscogniauxia mediterranea]|nr:hypothetical protein F5X96DRAFT_237471 [Biscogniauxia mediterranea]